MRGGKKLCGDNGTAQKLNLKRKGKKLGDNDKKKIRKQKP